MFAGLRHLVHNLSSRFSISQWVVRCSSIRRGKTIDSQNSGRKEEIFDRIKKDGRPFLREARSIRRSTGGVAAPSSNSFAKLAVSTEGVWSRAFCCSLENIEVTSSKHRCSTQIGKHWQTANGGTYASSTHGHPVLQVSISRSSRDFSLNFHAPFKRLLRSSFHSFYRFVFFVRQYEA